MAKKAKAPPKTSPVRTQLMIRAAAIKALERDGRLTARRLVDAARNPRHPMHRDFTWDNAVAGEAFRIDQARMLIAQVRVVITTSTKKLIAPAYVRDIEAAPRAGYVATTRLQNEREAAEETLLYETTRLQAQLERCREIASALELETELEAAIASVLELRSRLRRGGHAKEETRISA